MGAMVVDKFSHGNVVCPCFRVGATKDAEIGLNLLVEPLCFSIGLRVVCCGQGDFISKDMAEFFCKVHSKLRASIGDDFVKKSEASIEFSENDGSDSVRGDSFLCWA